MNGLLALITLTLLLPAGAPRHVLGPEAGPLVKRWVGGLQGLDVTKVPISQGEVTVHVGDSCVLRLTHPRLASCAGPQRAVAGEEIVCLSAGCDADKVRKAVAAAGELTLPWRVLEDDSSDARPVVAARRAAQTHLDIMDLKGARAALEPLLASPDVTPVELLSIVPALGLAGAGDEALAVILTPRWQSVDVGSRSLAVVVLTMGPAATAAAAEALVDADNGCRAAAIGSGLLMTGSYEAAGALSRTVRARAPDCFDAYLAEAEAWSQLRRGAELDVVYEAAKARFPGHERLTHLEVMALMERGDDRAVVAILEARLEAGDTSPGLMKRLLSFYVKEQLRTEKMETWLERAEANREDAIASFFAGVLLHYEKRFARSNGLLDSAVALLPALGNEPRVHIYRAMNAFNLGQSELAAEAITRAQQLEVQDPDVFYCQGEIFRDTDRPRATRALEIYWHQTRRNTDPNSSKQRRVRGLIAALERCQRDHTQGPCAGPWEHTFASAADQLRP